MCGMPGGLNITFPGAPSEKRHVDPLSLSPSFSLQMKSEQEMPTESTRDNNRSNCSPVLAQERKQKFDQRNSNSVTIASHVTVTNDWRTNYFLSHSPGRYIIVITS